jgi:hypothetical protein
MKPSIRFVAGYEVVAGAASLIAVAALMRPPMLDPWGFVNLGIQFPDALKNVWL